MTNAGIGAGDINYWAARAARAEDEIDRLRALLVEAEDAMPCYADGRYDDLFDRIDAALGSK